MKKVFGISLIAILMATPMLANADPVAGSPYATVTGEENIAAATAINSAPYGLASYHVSDANLATAGFVKGAYNASMKAINKVAADAQTALDGKQTIINDLETIRNGAAAGATALQIAGTGLSKDGTTVSLSSETTASLGKADTAVQSADLANKTLNIDAASIKLNGADVLTGADMNDYAKKTGVRATIANSTITVMNEWGSTDPETVRITPPAEYTETMPE